MTIPREEIEERDEEKGMNLACRKGEGRSRFGHKQKDCFCGRTLEGHKTNICRRGEGQKGRGRTEKNIPGPLEIAVI